MDTMPELIAPALEDETPPDDQPEGHAYELLAVG
jgi:hypothetical protein